MAAVTAAAPWANLPTMGMFNATGFPSSPPPAKTDANLAKSAWKLPTWSYMNPEKRPAAMAIRAVGVKHQLKPLAKGPEPNTPATTPAAVGRAQPSAAPPRQALTIRAGCEAK